MKALSNKYTLTPTQTVPCIGNVLYPSHLEHSAIGFQSNVSNETSVTLRTEPIGPSPYHRKILHKIENFTKLKENWDSYGAVPPKVSVIRQAKNLVRRIDSLGGKVYFFAPGPNGEIVIELKNNSRSIEIFLFDSNLDNKNEIAAFEEENCVEEAAFSFEGLPGWLKWLKNG